SRSIDAQTGELLHRKFDENLFVLGAQDFGLRYVGHTQKLGPDVLDEVSKLAMGKTFRRESIDNPERIAEFVVEAGLDNADRKSRAHVADAFADMVPDVRNFLRRSGAFQIDKDRRNAGARVTAQEIETRRFLKRALKPLGNLLERFLGRGAGPS